MSFVYLCIWYITFHEFRISMHVIHYLSRVSYVYAYGTLRFTSFVYAYDTLRFTSFVCLCIWYVTFHEFHMPMHMIHYVSRVSYVYAYDTLRFTSFVYAYDTLRFTSFVCVCIWYITFHDFRRSMHMIH